jgi:maltose O-acetyltransferase
MALSSAGRRISDAWLCLRGRGVRSAAPALPALVSVGDGCSIDPLVHFRVDNGSPITLGDGVVIWRHSELCGPVTIGSRTRLNRDVYVRPQTSIGADVSIGPFVRFVSDTHEILNVGQRAGRLVWKPIVVGDGAWIGASAIILGGVTIGRGAVVGAGSVVTRDVEPDCIYAGNPARLLRRLEPLAPQS